MNLSIPAFLNFFFAFFVLNFLYYFYGEEPDRPKFARTSLFKGTQENVIAMQTFYIGFSLQRWRDYKLQYLEKKESALTTLQIAVSARAKKKKKQTKKPT